MPSRCQRHLLGLEVRDDDDVATDELRRPRSAADARKYSAPFAAEVDRKLQEPVRNLNDEVLDARDAKVDAPGNPPA